MDRLFDLKTKLIDVHLGKPPISIAREKKIGFFARYCEKETGDEGVLFKLDE